jgi:phosphoribosylformylglycinamidine (FGAM) synthase PurS component
MQWKIEVGYKPTATDAMGEGIKKDIEDLGISGVDYVKTIQLYIVEGGISELDVKRICDDLLTDRVTQIYTYNHPLFGLDDAGAWVVEVRYKHGVTDAVGDSAVKGIKDLSIQGVSSAKTGRKFIIKGKLSQNDVEVICKRLLANDVIQSYKIVTRLTCNVQRF